MSTPLVPRMVRRRGPIGSTDEWLRRARRYLRVANLTLEEGFFDVAAFYAQQAAEFALKALQIHRTGRLARVHDLTRLARALSAPPRIVKLASLITPAYVTARYPDAGGRITRRLAESMIDGSRRIVRWVRRQIV